MNKQQQHFVNEMLRHGDKTKAYRNAYPDAKTDRSVESSVNRLLKNKKVKQAIDEPTNRMRAEAEADLKARMQGELLDFYECQQTLAQIVRGQYTTTKQVRVKDGFETIEVKPTVSNVLNALNQFFRLNNHYPQKKTAEDRKAEKAAAAHEAHEKWMREERPKIPAWPTDNPFRHPWGDIYPPEYKGPFFDPKDPNTREQFLAITEPYRLSKLTKEKEAQNSQPNTTTERSELMSTNEKDKLQRITHNNLQQPNQGRHFERSETREKSPEPMQADRPERQDDTANSQEISSPESIRDRNDDRYSAQQYTTTHNNNESSFPVLRPACRTGGEGCPQGRKGNTQHWHENTTEHNNIQHLASNIQYPTSNNTTTHNNIQPPAPTLEEQIAIKYKHTGPKVRQTMLRYALEKEGWQTIHDAFSMVHAIHMRHQHSGTLQMMKNFEKVKNVRNHPPHLRLPIEKETGWAIHPKYPNMMKRTRVLGWK